MSTTVFEIDKSDTTDVLSNALAYHPHLAELGVKFKVIKVLKFDKDDEPVVPSLKLHGAAAAGTIKVNGLKQRHLTGVDAVIELDGHVWETLTKPTRLALMDHELNHLVVVTDTDGKPQLDDIGRPKLKMRPDDWTLTGFLAVISRHGAAALEYQAVTRIQSSAEAAKLACTGATDLGRELGAKIDKRAAPLAA